MIASDLHLCSDVSATVEMIHAVRTSAMLLLGTELAGAAFVGAPGAPAQRGAVAAMSPMMAFDGEALVWAYRRLAAIEANRRLLVLVSDGAPMETATAGANRLGFLDDHLAAVTAALDDRDDVEVGALTLDADMSGIFRRSRLIDLDGTLSLGHYEVLADLFG